MFFLLLLYRNIELLSLMYTWDKVNEMGMRSVRTYVIHPQIWYTEIFVSAFRNKITAEENFINLHTYLSYRFWTETINIFFP